MNHDLYKITEIVDEAKNVKTFLFDRDIKAKPGHFVMAWLPGINEKPFSLSYTNGITVKNLGPFTSKLFELSIGDRLWLRGPYGNSFNSFVKDSNKYIIAGGTGAAPLAFFADSLNEKITVMLGARSRDELIFENRFRKKADVLTTVNESGNKGFVTDLMDEVKDIKENSQFFICGPEKMALSAIEKALRFTKPENIILSLERYMKCGQGVCGNCDMSGLRICTDGPIFSYESIRDNSGLGKFKRDKNGKRIEI